MPTAAKGQCSSTARPSGPPGPTMEDVALPPLVIDDETLCQGLDRIDEAVSAVLDEK